MEASGTFDLYLHGGRAPPWLFSRMVRLAGAIAEAIVIEHGEDHLLQNVSDPIWFQSFSNVLGYDWDSSGSTTVTTGAIREALEQRDVGVRVLGGKGRSSKRVPDMLHELAKIPGYGNIDVDSLKRASYMTAKVDNAVLQDGHNIYHHTIFVTKQGKWAVVQQGMNESLATARRYHWLDKRTTSFVVEPHTGVVGERVMDYVIDLTSRASEDARKVCVDLACEKVETVERFVRSIYKSKDMSLRAWIDGSKVPRYAVVHQRVVNWKALKEAYSVKPREFEHLVEIRGIGPSTLRALSMVAEIVFGERVSHTDPIKFSFAFGGKDGVPYPVNRRRMEEVSKILEDAINRSKIGDRERLNAIKRLKIFSEGYHL